MTVDPSHWRICMLTLPLMGGCAVPIPVDDGVAEESGTGESGFVDSTSDGEQGSETEESEGPDETETGTDETEPEYDACAWTYCSYSEHCVEGECISNYECVEDADCSDGDFCINSECMEPPSLVEACGEPPSLVALPIPEQLEGVFVLAAATADLDADGTAELVVGYDGDGGFHVRAIIGGEAVNTLVNWAASEITSFTVLDSNGDGAADLFWGSAHMIGDGAGGFGPPSDPIGVPFKAQRAIDVEGDGFDELLRNKYNSPWSIYENHAGVLTDDVFASIGYDSFTKVEVGDFDGDGDDDIAWATGGYSHFMRIADDNDHPYDELESIGAGWPSPIVGHLQTDKRHDLLSTSFYRQAQDQTWIQAWLDQVRYIGRVPGRMYKGVLADFDGDGIDELIAVRSVDGDQTLAWVDFDEQPFRCHADLGIAWEGDGFTTIWAADIDGDQRDELIIFDDGALQLYELP